MWEFGNVKKSNKGKTILWLSSYQRGNLTSEFKNRANSKL